MVLQVHRAHRFSIWPAAATVSGALVLIAALSLGYGLGTFGAVCGITVASGLALALGRGLMRAGQRALTPADRVTLTRAILTVGVSALVAESFVAAVPTVPLVVLASVALVLDSVDGRVARRTGTVHELGARFDMEVDALLILVLSAYVAAEVGWWVLAIGAAHYVLLIARHRWSWLRAPLPPRYWCKVVAALQGVVLTVAATGLLPAWLTALTLAVAAGLLAESFGREVWQLRQLRVRPERPGEVARAPREESVAVGGRGR